MELAIAKSKDFIYLNSEMANRHGLIAGATGTGKTVTLQVMAESFSSIGVPVFLADVKGDLSGISKKGEASDSLKKRLTKLGIPEPKFDNFPVQFWDIFGQSGHPIRATVSDIGPLLLSRILQLTDVQEDILNIVFKIADDQGLLLLDLKDLKSMLSFVSENAKQLSTDYGLVSTQSVAAISRSLLSLEQEGADKFFGEPMLDIFDMIKIDSSGKGMVNILSADKLLLNPNLYSTFLLWLLGELFESLPEVGDLEKPKFVFFFDEAHLLFDTNNSTLIDKIEQVVRLIRSKGVGVYFITQNPLDIPESILGQLGNRVQHALRAFTPKDQKAVKTAAETFRQNPAFSTVEAIMELGVGEALISFLDKDGKPSIVERAFILPPRSKIGPIDEDSRKKIINSSIIFGKYEKTMDRESAFEIIQRRTEEKNRRLQEEEAQKEMLTKQKNYQSQYQDNRPYSRQYYDYGQSRRRTTNQKSTAEKLATAALQSAARSVGSSVGRKLARGIFGSLLG
ncbi:MAG: DUF853 family protein [Spirochaetes bacterium]|jgi:DNA helicase HerA-like ATPase|nr:DUF853 family protein [Spirochaetota bacterium]NLJ04749.1 DUF853 family protein [Exilispira sp.]MBP8990770.1 DUF853 family protein [Spirochaetota bacterium]HOV46426.1 DUF853 family protein [Exilispira sp.]HPB48182.1 DUF853 family protein [Exilispira sp.]